MVTNQPYSVAGLLIAEDEISDVQINTATSAAESFSQIFLFQVLALYFFCPVYIFKPS
jgi:hypothetical protein